MDECTECYSNWPKVLASWERTSTSVETLTTLNSYLAWRQTGCRVYALSDVTLRTVGDRRGEALFIQTWGERRRLRSENQQYVEGYDQVTIPASLCV